MNREEYKVAIDRLHHVLQELGNCKKVKLEFHWLALDQDRNIGILNESGDILVLPEHPSVQNMLEYLNGLTNLGWKYFKEDSIKDSLIGPSE